MGKLAKFLFRLLVLAFVALAAYALFAELPAPRQPISVTLTEPATNE